MQSNKYRIKRGGLLVLGVLFLCVLLLSGCDKLPEGMLKQENELYTQGQIRLIAATERNRYQNLYTGQLWSVAADVQGNTFESLLKNQISRFLEELAVVDRMADEQGIQLTSQEEDDINNLAEEYYAGLSKEDLKYMQVSKDDVLDLYRKYYQADKTVSQMTESKKLEVSDAEAKVIRVERIETDTKEKAEGLLTQVSEDKADFASIAEKNSLNSQIEFSLEWDSDLKEPDKSAFTLEENEISDIIEAGGRFYIQKCVNAYDKQATALRKEQLAQKKKTEAFQEIYLPYQEKYRVRLNGDIWKNIDFSAGEGCESDNFFSLYHSYFSK